MERDFEKVHPSITAITTLYDQFEQFAEESALDEARENLEQLKERWQAVIQALAARQRAILVRLMLHTQHIVELEQFYF